MKRHTDPVRQVLVTLRLILFAVIAILFVLVVGKAKAQHQHTPEHMQAHDKLHKWYEKLMRPDVPNVSCCSKQDCSPADAKFIDGRWWVKKNGKLIIVPLEKINKDESFDTQAHLCAYPTTDPADESILCFVPPTSGM